MLFRSLLKANIDLISKQLDLMYEQIKKLSKDNTSFSASTNEPKHYDLNATNKTILNDIFLKYNITNIVFSFITYSESFFLRCA